MSANPTSQASPPVPPQSVSDRPIAIVIGATGGIGAALAAALAETHTVYGLSRHSDPPVDLLDEASIAHAAGALPPARIVVDATGFLHGNGFRPEKSWRELDPAHMAHAFAVNAIGPALLMKHFLPRLDRSGFAVFATISAKVGSIGDNRLGGWHAYRASKAALNQFVRTTSIELARRRTDAAIVSLHPGTVATPLSEPFAKTGLEVRPPAEAAAKLATLLRGLGPEANGAFLTPDGDTIPW